MGDILWPGEAEPVTVAKGRAPAPTPAPINWEKLAIMLSVAASLLTILRELRKG